MTFLGGRPKVIGRRRINADDTEVARQILCLKLLCLCRQDRQDL
jgi:hypothetical protein